MRHTLIALLLGISSIPAHADSFTPTQKTEIEKIIRGYLLEHPEILSQMVVEQESAKALETIRENRAALEQDGVSPEHGNPAGDVIMVEFFTYRCAVCRAVSPKLKALVEADGRIRHIEKQLPIYDTPENIDPIASKAAMAAFRLDPRKFQAFHDAILAVNSRPTDDVVMAAAKQAGYDTTALRRLMGDKLYDKMIADNFRLAEALGVDGTPAFVIGDRLVSGWDEDGIRYAIAQARIAAEMDKRRQSR